MNKHLFVLDTNTLISALLISNSVNRKVLEIVKAQGDILFSNQTFSELNNTLVRSKFDKYVSIEERLLFVETLELASVFIEIISDFKDCRDIKDNMFLNLAYDGQASYIITGDKDLLALHPFHKIKIITSGEFLEEYNSQ